MVQECQLRRTSAVAVCSVSVCGVLVPVSGSLKSGRVMALSCRLSAMARSSRLLPRPESLPHKHTHTHTETTELSSTISYTFNVPHVGLHEYQKT